MLFVFFFIHVIYYFRFLENFFVYYIVEKGIKSTLFSNTIFIFFLIFNLFKMALPSADKVKIWLFPSLISILGLMIWTDLQTIKTTLATAVIQTTTDKTDILNLKDRVTKLESVVFRQTRIVKSTDEQLPSNPIKDGTPLFTKIIATKPDEQKYVLENKINKTTL